MSELPTTLRARLGLADPVPVKFQRGEVVTADGYDRERIADIRVSAVLPLDDTDRALQLLNMVGLSGFADKMPYELSGGMQQRAAIARALVHDPKLVLMDEPFGALDALTREKMNLEMLRIWEESHKTFVVVTHSIQEAVFLGSRCAVLTSGPARMADTFPIDLPWPRKLHIKTTPEFGQYVSRVYSLLGVE